MTEPTQPAVGGESAGAMLRAAREKQGLHVAALAASIKITVAKLEALENDRFDELPDITFTRALALTVCRALKIDPQPVLERMPQGGATGLGKVTGGLNTPFRERPGRSSDAGDYGLARRPLIWLALLVLIAALVVLLLPSRLWHGEPAPALADNGAAAGATAGSEAPPQPAAAPPVAASAAAPASEIASAAETAETVQTAAEPPARTADEAASAAAAAPDQLALRAEKASWVQVVDGAGQVLIKRTLQPGESVTLAGKTPLRLTVGNAATTKVEFRGKAVDLAAATVGNVARIELK